MANPVEAFVQTVVGATALGGSAFYTFSFHITAGYEAFIPVRILTTTNVSAGGEVYVYRSTDGGANYETEATLAGVFARKSSANQMRTVNLPNGSYYIVILAGGPNGVTVYSETAMIISAYS